MSKRIPAKIFLLKDCDGCIFGVDLILSRAAHDACMDGDLVIGPFIPAPNCTVRDGRKLHAKLSKKKRARDRARKRQ